MVYESTVHTGFGMAVSMDGKNWIKSNLNPIFTANNTYNCWTYKISYPSFCNFDNEYRLYYTGYDSNNYPVIVFAEILK